MTPNDRTRRISLLNKIAVGCTVLIVILVLIGYEIFQCNVVYGIIGLCLAAAVYLGALLLLVPSYQSIKFTDKSISFNSYRINRRFSWEEINDVRIEEKKVGSQQELRVVLDVI